MSTRLSAVNESSPRSADPLGKAGFLIRQEALPSTGTLRLAVLFVDFEESEADYSTQEEAEQGLPYVEQYLETASYGKLDIDFVPLHKGPRQAQGRRRVGHTKVLGYHPLLAATRRHPRIRLAPGCARIRPRGVFVPRRSYRGAVGGSSPR